MIYFKIYFTLFVVVLVVGIVSWLLMDLDDHKRGDLWFKISIVSWIILLIMVIIGTLSAIWLFD